MDAVNLLVPSGALVSSAFFVSRLDRPVILQVPSMAANGVRLEWSTVSGTAPFAALHDPQAGALAATVFSGTAGGFARIFRSGALRARQLRDNDVGADVAPALLGRVTARPLHDRRGDSFSVRAPEARGCRPAVDGADRRDRCGAAWGCPS